MFRTLATAVAFLSFGTGCIEIPAAILIADAIDGPDAEPYEFGVDTGYMAEQSNVTGRMMGDLPLVQPFDREVDRAALYRFGSDVEIELHLIGEDWAMLGGGFDSSELIDGEPRVLQSGEQWVYGCAGPGEYQAEFDRPADTVEVVRDTVVVNGEPMIELTVTASFGDEGEVTAVVVTPAEQPNSDD